MKKRHAHQLKRRVDRKLLTREIAGEIIARRAGNIWRFKTMEDEAAEVLASHKGKLMLNGLGTLSVRAAESLSRHEGELKLNRLRRLPTKVAEALGRRRGSLALQRLAHLSIGAARALSQRNGMVALEGMRSLPDRALLPLGAPDKCPVLLPGKLRVRLRRFMRLRYQDLRRRGRTIDPKEWQGGRLVLPPAGVLVDNPCENKSGPVGCQSDPLLLIDWYQGLLPAEHKNQGMSDEAARVLVENYLFFDWVRQQEQREEASKTMREFYAPRVAGNRAMREVAVRAGVDPASLRQKHQALAEMAAAGNFALVAEMLVNCEDGWMHESLLARSTINSAGILETGEPLNRLGRVYGKIQDEAGRQDYSKFYSRWEREKAKEEARQALAQGIGALALHGARRACHLGDELNIQRLRGLTVGAHTFNALAEHFFPHYPHVAPVFDDGSLSGMTELNASAASCLMRRDAGQPLDLSGLKILPEPAAEALSLLKGKLNLSGLETLSDLAAQALGREQSELELGGLKTLSDGAAEGLSRHKGELCLGGVQTLSDPAAEALGRHEGTLRLRSLKSLSDQAAEGLTRHKGALDLHELKTLSDRAAEALGRHEGSLDLGSLKTLSDQALEGLSHHTGGLNLWSLQTCSKRALEKLAAHKGEVTIGCF